MPGLSFNETDLLPPVKIAVAPTTWPFAFTMVTSCGTGLMFVNVIVELLAVAVSDCLSYLSWPLGSALS